MCVCTYACGMFADTGRVCMLVPVTVPSIESWHIWSAVWGLGQWGTAQMHLCNAKPQVPLMPLTSPVLPMALLPPVSPSSLREHGPGGVQVTPV